MRDRIACPGVGTPADTTPALGDAGDGRRYLRVACPSCGYDAGTWNVPAVDRDRPTPFHVAPDARLTDILRAAATRGQYGHARTPAGYYLPDPARETRPAAAAYWVRDNLGDMARGLTDERVLRLATLAARYRRLHHLATEVWPAWAPVGRVHYADNSIEEKQVARDGRRRTVMVLGPGGDRCF